MHSEMHLAQGTLDNTEGKGEACVGVDTLLHHDGADMRIVLQFYNQHRLAAYIAEHRLQLLLSLVLVQLKLALAQDHFQYLTTCSHQPQKHCTATV